MWVGPLGERDGSREDLKPLKRRGIRPSELTGHCHWQVQESLQLKPLCCIGWTGGKRKPIFCWNYQKKLSHDDSVNRWNGGNTENKMVKVRKDTNTCWRLFYFTLTTTFRGRPYYTHFIEEETEVQQSYFAKIIKLINRNKWQNQLSASLSASRLQVPSSLLNYLHVSLAYWSGLSASLWASSSVSLPSYSLNKIIQ